MSAKPRISRRIAAIAESATLAVDAKAKALKAAGRPVIGFGAGEPDFPTPQYIVEAAIAAAAKPANHRYTPTPGLPELRDAIVAKTKRDSNLDISADQVLVTNGGKQAVYQAFASIIDPDDEVILPSPYWTTYPECIKLAGGIAVEVFAVKLRSVDGNLRDSSYVMPVNSNEIRGTIVAIDLVSVGSLVKRTIYFSFAP